jgi:8-oxo-dGTP pyrophosphatase MutT (NUDIX family)
MHHELKPWQQLSYDYLHREAWFNLRRDRVLKGNGEVMYPYYVLEYTHWASVFPVTTEGKVILLRQYRYGLGEWSIEVPGGIMDPHETNPADSARRELQEETGYSCAEIKQVAKIAPNPATANNWMYSFLATGCELTHDQDLDSNEELEVLLLSMGDVKQLLRDNKIIQALHTTTMFYALQALGDINI